MSLLNNATDVVIEQDLKQFLVILLVAMSAASLPKIFTALRQVPYTLLLLIVGLSLALMDVRLLNLSPGMILMVFLPPLLFEAAWNMQWSALRKEILPSSLFAIGGVVVSIAGVAWALHQFADIEWTTALLVGACLSATDSAAVLGIFRELGAGTRLTTLLEGESLFNDGASIVAFSVLVNLASNPQPFHLSTTVLQFFVVTGIGLSVGGAIGVCVAVLTDRYDLAWVEQALTLVTAYGTYLLVEELGGSGVIGVVTAGLVIGNFAPRTKIEAVPSQPAKQATLVEFWEFVVFLVNSILFLLLGDQIHLPKLIQYIDTSTIAIVAVIASRAVAIYGLSALTNAVAKTNISGRDQTVLWWTGLRGSVSIALALSIPVVVANRGEIIANSFGVVWFTLLVQGLTTKLFLEKLHLLKDQSLRQQYTEMIARRVAMQQVLDHLLQSKPQLLISPALYQSQIATVKQQLQHICTELESLQEHYPELGLLNLQQHQEKLLSIEIDVYSQLMQSGLLQERLAPIVATQLDLLNLSSLQSQNANGQIHSDV